jgi:hypothetical protein
MVESDCVDDKLIEELGLRVTEETPVLDKAADDVGLDPEPDVELEVEELLEAGFVPVIDVPVLVGPTVEDEDTVSVTVET